jgi:hypothetical protein
MTSGGSSQEVGIIPNCKPAPGIIPRMVDRRMVYSAGMALSLALATFWAAPHRPEIRPLPRDWAETKDAVDFHLSVFPDGPDYAGDWLGLQALADSSQASPRLQIRLDSPDGSPLIEGGFPRSGLGDFWLGQWPWIWNSTGQAGWHTLYVNQAGGSGAGADPFRRIYPVQILPDALRPVLRRDARWRKTESECCIYYYLTGTESERDLAGLIDLTEQAYRAITARLTASPSKLTVEFLPRLLGQGGLADGEGILSYMDRNATGMDFPVVLTHEMVHLVAGSNLPPGRTPPAFLSEGWAVYITGGHYRAPEPLADRAAVVYQSGAYIPLAALVDSFYAIQHETAYIEAGAFVEFLIGRFGWERVYAMFRDPSSVQPASAGLDSILRTHLQTSLKECESEWLEDLRARAPSPDQIRDVQFTVSFFDDLRRYQSLYTPGGNVSAMWIPDPAAARKRGLTADYLPSPESDEAIALETMFRTVQWQSRALDWDAVRATLNAIERVLDAKERRAPDPAFASPLADDYRRLVHAILRSGYEPLDISLADGRAETTVRPLGGLEKGAQVWQLTGGTWSRVV